jgi:hypothetical protein
MYMHTYVYAGGRGKSAMRTYVYAYRYVCIYMRYMYVYVQEAEDSQRRLRRQVAELDQKRRENLELVEALDELESEVRLSGFTAKLNPPP